MNGLYYYKLVSPYPEDVTKNCKLTINEIDHNFVTLKDNDIKKAEFIRSEKTLVLTRNNGEKLIVPLYDVTYNLEVNAECGESGTTLTISYDCVDGKKTVTIANILTADNLMDIIGSDILTKVITDGTLKGNGTMRSPLGIAGVEKTGMLAPALSVFDLTTGGTLPEVAKLGTRYVTKEYVNDYGYLYNGVALDKIEARMKELYVSRNSKEDERFAWRVPTKADWDALLNSIEPCDPGKHCREHGSAQCHIELGCMAGKFLKSECGWCNQPDCECNVTKPNTGCTLEDEDYYVEPGNPDCNGDIEDFNNDVPDYKPESPVGVDKYGMTILPAGTAVYRQRQNRVEALQFREQAFFWTSTHVHNDPTQDRYVKIFDCEKKGVTQVAECPSPYYSVRLVKDYDGSNYYDSEYIDGILYKTILFPEAGQVWLASNYADKSYFKEYDPDCATAPEVVEVNNGEIVQKRVEMFINEWNGYYWEKRIMKEGDTIVIENPCFDQGTGTTTEVCVMYEDNVPDCIEVEIPKVAQSNIEYRVFTEDDNCNKILVNTDDLVVERVIHIIVPLLIKEREERIKSDTILSGMIITEREERISGDTALSGAIDDLRADMEEADAELWEAIAKEASARTEVDNQLWEAIAKEYSARTEVDNQIWEALNKEINDRLTVDAQQWAAINGETERAQTVEAQLWAAINAETARAQEVEAQLWDGINGETARAQQVEADLWEAINNEIERATARENEIDGQLIDWSKNPFEMHAAVGKDEPNLELTSKDENPEHSIKVEFYGSFGQI